MWIADRVNLRARDARHRYVARQRLFGVRPVARKEIVVARPRGNVPVPALDGERTGIAGHTPIVTTTAHHLAGVLQTGFGDSLVGFLALGQGKGQLVARFAVAGIVRMNP